MAVGFTYENGKLTSATPSFRGVEPFENFLVHIDIKTQAVESELLLLKREN